MEVFKEVLEHEHPLCLIDLQPNYPQYEEEFDDDDDDDYLITKQDFRSQCARCSQEINWFHRYYYKCTHSCEYFLHKFCAELPLILDHKIHSAHTLILCKSIYHKWSCNICKSTHKDGELSYHCSKCSFDIDSNCAMESVEDQIMHHPSHNHPLVAIPEPILCKCNACGKEHKGIFYICSTCFRFFIHSDCAFLPKTLLIQHSTDDAFTHTHPLILSYSFPKVEQEAKFDPFCRVCDQSFKDENLWIYKCEKCRFYAHLDCATSREEPYMSIFSYIGRRKTIKNFEDSEYPNLLHLPFPDVSYSIPKHMFLKDEDNLNRIYHQHPLILVHSECNDITSPNSSRTDLSSFHNPMKKIELLCDGCVKPITSEPFYKCVTQNEHCNFVLHEWCTRLPAEIQNHPGHPQHTLTFYPKAFNSYFSVFTCEICSFVCNGFAYGCVKCDYLIDVSCSFIPEHITHEAHPGHLLSRFVTPDGQKYCRLCKMYILKNKFAFRCYSCGVYVHALCALFLHSKIRHKYDKHPMSLSYFPIENHKSEYFCEVCEEEFDPEFCFYHCLQCGFSIHSACAPSILQSETSTYLCGEISVFIYVNFKFGRILNTNIHPHPLVCIQGRQSDGQCNTCEKSLQYNLTFKCLQCNVAICWDCC